MPSYRLVIIGLDGATFDVLDPLFARGQLPNLRRLAEQGWRTELCATVPPATLPSWTSFLTAAPPHCHGVADLLTPIQDSYDLEPANARQRVLPTFLNRLSQAGLRVASLGVPGTFPAEPVFGVCIPGFDAPGAHQAKTTAIWPPAFAGPVRHLGGWRYATFNEYTSEASRLHAAVSAMEDDIAAKTRLATAVMNRQPWDVFFLHLQAADTVGHHFWHTYDAGSPRHQRPELADAIPRVYRSLDACVGAVAAAAMPNTRILVLSDHGMGGSSDVAVYLNRWLQHLGLLTFHSRPRRWGRTRISSLLRRLMGGAPLPVLGLVASRLPASWRRQALATARGACIDFRNTRAFSYELDYAPAIWLNRQGRFPAGRVNLTEAKSLLAMLSAEAVLLSHPETGLPPVRRVHPRDVDRCGSCADRLPDLIIEPAWPGGYRPSFLRSQGPGPAVSRLRPHEFTGAKDGGLPGVHHPHGILMVAGPGIQPRTLVALDIAAAGALVYALIGLRPPQNLLTRLPDALTALLEQVMGPTSLTNTSTLIKPSSSDDETVLCRLREFGYID